MKSFVIMSAAVLALGLVNGCTYSKGTIATIKPENVTEGSEVTESGEAGRSSDAVVPGAEAVAERPAGAADEPRLGDAPRLPEGAEPEAPVRVGDLGPRDGDAIHIDPGSSVATPPPAAESPLGRIPTDIHPAVLPGVDSGLQVVTEMSGELTTRHGTIHLLKTNPAGRLQICQGSSEAKKWTEHPNNFHCFDLPGNFEVKESTEPALISTYEAASNVTWLHAFAHINEQDGLLYVRCPSTTQDGLPTSTCNCFSQIVPNAVLAGDASPVPATLRDGTLYVFFQQGGLVHYLRKTAAESRFSAPKEITYALAGQRYSCGSIWYNPSVVVTTGTKGDQTLQVFARDNHLSHGHLRRMTLKNPLQEGTEPAQWSCWTFNKSLEDVGDTQSALGSSPTAVYNAYTNEFFVYGKSYEDRVVKWINSHASLPLSTLSRSGDWNGMTRAPSHKAPLAFLSPDGRSVHSFQIGTTYGDRTTALRHRWNPDLSTSLDDFNRSEVPMNSVLTSEALNPFVLTAGMDGENVLHVFTAETLEGDHRLVHLYATKNADGNYTWVRENLHHLTSNRGLAMVITTKKPSPSSSSDQDVPSMEKAAEGLPNDLSIDPALSISETYTPRLKTRVFSLSRWK